MTNAASSPLAFDDAPLSRAHPLSQFGLDALVAGAARQRAGALALISYDGGKRGALTYADLSQSIGAFVSRLRDFDFTPGERVLLVDAPAAQAFVALTALVASGLEPVLAPVHLSAEALVRAAEESRAQAVFAPARYAELELEERLLTVAAKVPSIRLLGTLGGETIDGAVDFSQGALRGPIARVPDGWTPGERAMIGAVEAGGAVSFAAQGALLGHALDFLRVTRKSGAAPVLSLVSPCSFGGLVAGPLAALLAGAPLHLLAPFEAQAFLELLDAIGPARLVAPSAALPDLARAGLLENGALVSVAAISKRGAKAAQSFDAACPVVQVVVDGAAIEIEAAKSGESSRVA